MLLPLVEALSPQHPLNLSCCVPQVKFGTLGLFRDMLDGLGVITKQANINKMDKKLPVLFIAGDQDPVGDMGKGVEKAFHCFQKAGLRDVSLKLYHGLRHEILNEIDKKDVYDCIGTYLAEIAKRYES